MFKKFILLFLLFVFISVSDTIILQNGLNDYNGSTDRSVVDTYNFMKTSWWLSEEAFAGLPNYASPDQEQFAIGFFTC